jgi:hypothetical protein
MKQITRTFHRHYLGDSPVENQLNEYLTQHPNYSVEKINYSRPNPNLVCEDLFVVFNINEN